jgi:hypothetical protein
MMHEQAFHTCCRHGLTSNPGFQYNAASAGLTQELLSRLALVHAGYQAPRDRPPEPTSEELGLFPISLRCRPVEGAGPVLSRTAYVGREFRGRDGEPDTGRFGNYFSHMVVSSDGEEPFDGLLPIELWEADHWSVREARDPMLAPLERLSPGPLDLERALAALLPDRGEWIPQVVSAVGSAIGAGPRVVLVEDPGPRAAAWVALVCFALPRALSSRLTFSTFEGRPRYVDLQLTLTTPSCDVAFPSHELGQQVSLLDVAGGAPDPEHQTLLGHVIATLATTGAEALSATGRAVQRSGCEEQASLGAAFAILGGHCELACHEEDVLEILRLLAAWHDSTVEAGALCGAASQLAALPELPASDLTLAGWWQLHAVARDGGHPDSADLVDVCLGELLTHIDEIGQRGELVSGYAPVRPAIGRLAEFLDVLQAAEDSQRTGARIAAGWQLGLVGANDELDRRFATVMAAHLEHPEVRRSFTSICIDPRHHQIVSTVVSELLERAANEPVALFALTTLAAEHEVVEEALSSILRRSDSFEIVLAGARAELHNRPQSRMGLIGRLASLARDEHQQNLIKTLYGPQGPVEMADRLELLDAYAAAARTPPREDLRAGWSIVASQRFAEQDASRLEPLVRALARADPEARRQPAYVSWTMLAHAATLPADGSMAAWMRDLRWVSSYQLDLPAVRYAELARETARLVLNAKFEEHQSRFLEAAEIVGEQEWVQCCERELAGCDEQTMASLFEVWISAASPLTGQQIVLDVLLPALLAQAGGRKEVAEKLPRHLRKQWQAWSDQHPPHRTGVRRVARIRRRGS